MESEPHEGMKEFRSTEMPIVWAFVGERIDNAYLENSCLPIHKKYISKAVTQISRPATPASAAVTKY